MKRFITSIFIALVACGGVSAQSTGPWTSGKVTIELSGDGTLTVGGTGAMKNFKPTKAPWYRWAPVIKRVVINAGVTGIGQYAFEGCGLTSIVCSDATPPSVSDEAFVGVDRSQCTLTVPAGSVNAYRASGVWSSFFKPVNVGVNQAGYGSVSPPTLAFPKGTFLVTDFFTPVANTGHQFVKWTNKGSDDAISNFVVDAGIDLVAHFEEILTITLSIAGGKGSVSPSEAVQVMPSDGSGSKTYTFIPNAGYEINTVLVDGKNVTAAVLENGNTYNFTQVAANHTISVSFKTLTYAVTYVLNGGTNHANNPVDYTIDSPTIVMQNPTREGYTFAGWVGGSSIAMGSTGDKTFTAQWTAAVYPITYVLDGGTNHAGNPVSYTSESAAITLQNPTKVGYSFSQWAEGGVIATSSTGAKTFTAQWTATSYPITYNMNGGVNHPENPPSYAIEGQAIVLKDPTREGYTFAGWAEGSIVAAGSTGEKKFTAQWATTPYPITYVLNGGTNNVGNPGYYTIESAITLQRPTKSGYTGSWAEGNTIQVGSSGAKTFTAQWTVPLYAITYVLNGGTNNAANPTNYTIESPAITLQDPVRAGYTFARWAEGNAIATGSTGDKTFTAIWTPPSYAITYEMGGGTNNSNNPVAYTIESPTITLQDPTKPGYSFAGWAEGNTIATGNTGDKQFTAQWTNASYTITYVLNGGTNEPTNPTGYTVESPAITLQDPTRTGYTFAGWAEGNTIATGSTGNKTFTAQWAVLGAYAITYELNGGTNNATNPFSYTIESPTITLQDPTRTGYAFLGWAEGNTIVAGSSGSKTFTAQWTTALYNITYANLKGATNSNPANYTAETAITLVSPSAIPGYVFDGWTEGNTLAVGSTGDKTFTAKWTLTPYTITYYADGGTGASNRNYTIEDANITLPIPAKTGYTFDGWYANSDLSGGAVKMVPNNSTGNVEFWAKWSTTSYTITYANLMNATNSNPTTYTAADAITIENPGVRTGFNFYGWAEGSTISAGSTGDKTFTARWVAIGYPITYVLNGGTNNAGNPSSYTIESAAIALKAPAKVGYAFAGWAEGSDIAAGSTGERTFTAQWTTASFPITYVLSGGSNNVDNPTYYTVESPAITIHDPTRDNFTFEGWAEGNAIKAGSTGNKTFTAKWKAIKYEIAYVLDGGTNNPNNPQSYTAERAVTLQKPSKAGYDFTSWAEGESIPAGSTGNKTFTAQWKQREATDILETPKPYIRRRWG